MSRSDVIQLFRNLKMPPNGNARTRSVAIYVRATGKNTNDGVEKKLLHIRNMSLLCTYKNIFTSELTEADKKQNYPTSRIKDGTSSGNAMSSMARSDNCFCISIIRELQ